jgi:ComF family protein
MHLLSLFFPKRCVGCGRLGLYFCDVCKTSIEPIQSSETICPTCGKSAMGGKTHPKCKTNTSLDGLISFFHYRGVIKQAIKSIKYRYVTDVVQELIKLCVYNNGTIKQCNHHVIIPIPLHSSRLKFRGFNQAEKLGEQLSTTLHMQFRTDVLKRTRKTTPQVEMRHRIDRLQNMKHVFSCNNITMRQWNYQTIILFDDVWTTGATLRSACSELKKSGVKEVWGMTIAR